MALLWLRMWDFPDIICIAQPEQLYSLNFSLLKLFLQVYISCGFCYTYLNILAIHSTISSQLIRLFFWTENEMVASLCRFPKVAKIQCEKYGYFNILYSENVLYFCSFWEMFRIPKYFSLSLKKCYYLKKINKNLITFFLFGSKLDLVCCMKNKSPDQKN